METMFALLLIAVFAALYMALSLHDADRERAEAVEAYNRAYALGHSAGEQAAAEQYRSRVPYKDGYSAGYRAAMAEQGRVLELER